VKQTFRDFERIRSSTDFQRARREGRRRSGRCLLLWTRLRQEEPPRAARLGIVVGRRHGIAARRNLFKRRLREIFRREKDRFARGWDYVVTPAAPKGAGPLAARGAAKGAQPEASFPPSFDALRQELLNLLK
jgi:ribonuclease P protein component